MLTLALTNNLRVSTCAYWQMSDLVNKQYELSDCSLKGKWEKTSNVMLFVPVRVNLQGCLS